MTSHFHRDISFTAHIPNAQMRERRQERGKRERERERERKRERLPLTQSVLDVCLGFC
jgi:hypothetical protein